MPVSYLRHILQMLPEILVMLEQLSGEHLDRIRGFNTQPWDMLEGLDRKVGRAHLIEDDHVKRCGLVPRSM